MPSNGHFGGWLISKSQLFEELQLVDTKAIQQRGGVLTYRPIVAIFGEKCYAWNKSKNALIVIGTADVFKEGSTALTASDIQEWQLSQRLGFDVTHIVPFSSSPAAFGGTGATCVLLWGKNGLAVVTNQNVSSKITDDKSSETSSANSNGIQRMIKKTLLVGEKTYIDHPNLSIIQAKWLPCTFATHSKTVVVLNSDNYFRFYQIDNNQIKEAKSCGSVSVEPNNSSAIPFVNRSGRFTADVEDESVADFDVGPCLPKSKYYPLFVLRESGCVSYVLIRFVGKNPVPFSDVHGIISVAGQDPPEERTATSLIVSKEFPMFVAIGFCGGLITHSLLLPDIDNNSINDRGDIDQGQNMEEKFIYDTLNLFVKERLELDFLSDSSQSPLRLIGDPLHSYRYTCVHNVGMHIVTAHFYPEVVRFFHTEDDEDLPEATKCSYQLLLRWRLGEEAKSQTDLLALTFSQRKPQKLLCVLQDLRTLVFELPDPTYEASISSIVSRAEDNSTESDHMENGHDNIFSGTSNVHETCEKLLKRSSVEPYLCSKEEIPIRELEEYVVQTIGVKSERLGGVEDGMQYLLRTVMAMQDKLKKMEEIVNNLNNERGELQSVAENLAETYEECVDQDEKHMKRLEAILNRYHRATPVVTDKEKEWAKSLEAIKDDLPDLKTSVETLKERLNEKNVSPQAAHDSLTPSQIRQIREEMKSQNKSLNELSYSLKQISEHMYYPALMSARPPAKE